MPTYYVIINISEKIVCCTYKLFEKPSRRKSHNIHRMYKESRRCKTINVQIIKLPDAINTVIDPSLALKT